MKQNDAQRSVRSLAKVVEMKLHPSKQSDPPGGERDDRHQTLKVTGDADVPEQQAQHDVLHATEHQNALLKLVDDKVRKEVRGRDAGEDPDDGQQRTLRWTRAVGEGHRGDQKRGESQSIAERTHSGTRVRSLESFRELSASRETT